MNKKPLLLGIPLLISLLFSSLLFVEFYRSLESKVYDLLLHVKPEVQEAEDLLLVTIDDPTITHINMYPLSRDIFADGLILMRELGADYAILDIEFIDRSPSGINNQYLDEQIPDRFSEVFGDLAQQQTAFFRALQNGQIPLDQAEDFILQLDDYSEMRRQELLSDVGGIARDNDDYLGRAVSFFGNVICTVNMMDAEDLTTPDELRDLTREMAALNPKITGPGRSFAEAADIKPSITPIISRSLNAGFPRVSIDSDGVRRRIDLIYDYRGELYPQLGFSALLQKMEVSELEINEKQIILKEALSREGTRQDITVPLDQNGRMMINWPAKKFIESFRHVSFLHLYRHDRLLSDLLFNLRLMEARGLLDPPFFKGSTPLLDLYSYSEALKQDRLADDSRETLEEYREIRNMFFSETAAFLNGEAEESILQELDYYLTFPDLSEEQVSYFRDLQAFIPEVFGASRNIIGQIEEIRNKLAGDLAGAICVIGYSGTSTTDIGVNPFEKEYMNMGLYAAVTNTILSGQFLDESPVWIPIVITVLLSFLTGLIVSRRSPAYGLIAGVSILLATELILTLFFVFTGIYIPMLTPGLSILLSFLASVSINMLKTAREKGYIRSAFAQYLSDAVIKDILEDPSKLSLGGEEKHLTAVFTDVKGFSTISEQLTPPQLVALLNEYLTEMSNLILDARGTIDKYEGDAIISFFGAPHAFNDHAVKACRAAIKMKKAEAILNEHLVAENKTPGPLLTRIGINTGDMVVGNMGTQQKMDYTMMGNAVNLAARLEGVNKQYGTWLMISDSTYRETGNLFTVRQLDRVRVVGINEPVRLYELIEEKNLTADAVLEGLEHFHRGMELFENRQWTEATEHFKKTRTLIPEDPPSEIYMKRCVKFLKEPPPADWDGVFNLTQK